MATTLWESPNISNYSDCCCCAWGLWRRHRTLESPHIDIKTWELTYVACLIALIARSSNSDWNFSQHCSIPRTLLDWRLRNPSSEKPSTSSNSINRLGSDLPKSEPPNEISCCCKKKPRLAQLTPPNNHVKGKFGKFLRKVEKNEVNPRNSLKRFENLHHFHFPY